MRNSRILILILLTILICCRDRPSTTQKTSSANPIQVGPNILVKSQFTNLAIVEPHISAHPSDNNHLLIAAMVVTDNARPYESCRLSSFVSTDGGTTWEETPHDWWGYDPWTAILPDGNTLLSWIGTPGSFQDLYPIIFLRSTDGGKNWLPQHQKLEGGHDGTKIAATNDAFYFTTIRFEDDMAANIQLYKGDSLRDLTWVTEVDGKGERLNFCEPAILSDGTVVIPAALWKGDSWVHTLTPGSQLLSAPFKIASTLGKGYYHLAVDKSDGPFKDRLYFVRAKGYGNSFEGVWLNFSSDKGKQWSSDVRVDRFDNPSFSKAYIPTLAVNQDGVIGISWVDSQTNEDKQDVYFSFSKDGGTTFSDPARITEVSSDPRTNANNVSAENFPGGGHYMGLAARSDGSFQLAWSDSRTGVFELYTCTVSVK